MTLKVPDSFVPDIAQEAITEGIAGAIVAIGVVISVSPAQARVGHRVCDRMGMVSV